MAPFAATTRSDYTDASNRFTSHRSEVTAHSSLELAPATCDMRPVWRFGIMPQLMLIDGERVPSVTGEFFDVQDPATEELLDQAPLGNEQDARAAIAAANVAFKSWRKTSAHEKAELLH